MDQIKGLFEGKIDYQGQRLSDRINQEGIVMGAVLALLLGFALDSLFVTMCFYGLSIFMTFVAVVPPWPVYTKHQTKWLPNLPESPSTDEKADGAQDSAASAQEKAASNGNGGSDAGAASATGQGKAGDSVASVVSAAAS